jgi:hypothetical protein
MEAVSTAETTVSIYQTTWYNTPEDGQYLPDYMVQHPWRRSVSTRLHGATPLKTVSIYQTTWYNTPEDGHHYTRCCENLRFHWLLIMGPQLCAVLFHFIPRRSKCFTQHPVLNHAQIVSLHCVTQRNKAQISWFDFVGLSAIAFRLVTHGTQTDYRSYVTVDHSPSPGNWSDNSAFCRCTESGTSGQV